MYKRMLRRLIARIHEARWWLPINFTREMMPASNQRSTSPRQMPSPGLRRAGILLARALFCVVILLNLAGGGILWLSKAQIIGQSANSDLPTHLARIKALLAQPDMLRPDVLARLSTELAAARQDLQILRQVLPLNAQLGLGASGDTAHALRLGADLAQWGEDFVAAARILQPDLAGLTQSILQGPSATLQAGETRLTLADIQAAQRAVARAKQDWLQVSSDWDAFTSGVPTLSSPELNTIVRTVDRLGPTLANALAALSAVLDWSPALVGLNGPARVLVVEEDPDVLRPTGGIITHYALLTFTHGVLSAPIQLRSVADLDCPRATCAVTSLPPIAKWIPISNAPVPLADANLDADLSASGWGIFNHFEQEGGPPVAGILVITRNAVADLLGAVGPIKLTGVPGAFTAQNVMRRMRALDQLKSTERHTVTGGASGDVDMRVCEAILAKLATLAPAQRLALGRALLHALATKDLQVFTTENRVEASLARLDVAGNIPAPDPTGDSLEIVDTNVSGLPINPYITESAADLITLDAAGGARHQLTITYHYAPQAGNKPAPAYRDVVRVIVPNGMVGGVIGGPCATVTLTQAFHRVLACALTLAPGATVALHVTWQVPQAWTATSTTLRAYPLQLQRQPGANISIHLAITPPPGQAFAEVTQPGLLTASQITLAEAPLLTDITLQAFF